jgi:hypothetical protein
VVLVAFCTYFQRDYSRGGLRKWERYDKVEEWKRERSTKSRQKKN